MADSQMTPLRKLTACSGIHISVLAMSLTSKLMTSANGNTANNQIVAYRSQGLVAYRVLTGSLNTLSRSS